MTKNAMCTIVYQKPIAKNVFELRLAGPTDAFTAPGQFVNIKLDGFYLRRPISVCDWDSEGMTLVYKILGKGTAQLATYPKGKKLDLLLGLGNGFDFADKPNASAVLVAGGVGVPPMYGLAKRMASSGIAPKVILGFRSEEDVFYTKEFSALGCDVSLCTDDGSAGQKGNVADILSRMEYSYYYSCGPEPMLRAVHALGLQKGVGGLLSFEERMGCGFGACMGCSCKTLTGYKRICQEGPVLQAEEVRFT